MRAIDVMVRDVVTVHPDTDIADAIRLLAEHDVSARRSSTRQEVWSAFSARLI
jgi:CBS domain-containing protein